MDFFAPTRMLKNKTVFDESGKRVVVRLFSRGKIFLITKGKINQLETCSEEEAKNFFFKLVKDTSKGTSPLKKRKSPIIFRGGLPSLGKR